MERVRMRSVRVSVAYLLITLSFYIFSDTAGALPSDRVASSAQVTAAIKSSISIKTTSAAVRATLKQFSSSSSFDLTGPSTYGACDPYNSEALALSPKPCFFGNLRGTKTIVLVGDSNVGNWVPALNLGLAATPYRLAVFGFSSCGLPNLPYTASSGSLYKRCRQWHTNLPTAIRALHPAAVLAASGAVDSTYSTKTWVNGVKNVFVEATLGSSTTKRILMGTSPFFGESAVTCLTVHPDPQDCSLHYTSGSGFYGSILSRDKQIASASNAKLVDTSRFFCYSNTCSPVIGNILVYSDIDHVTIAYSSFISKVVTSAVLAALK
jgi:hypothetical protein